MLTGRNSSVSSPLICLPSTRGGFRFVSLAVSQPLLSRYSMAEAQEYDEELADYEEAEEEDSTKTAAAADSA
jgi:hypothetical protein